MYTVLVLKEEELYTSSIHTEVIIKNDNLVPSGKVWQKHPGQKRLERLLEVK